MYVIGVNTTGTTPVDTYSGQFYDCRSPGTIISRANDAEQLVFTDLDPAARGQQPVVHFPVEKDRRDALYRSLSR